VEDLYNREYDLGPVTLKVSHQWCSLKYTVFWSKVKGNGKTIPVTGREGP
jgi:hypothetical protein